MNLGSSFREKLDEEEGSETLEEEKSKAVPSGASALGSPYIRVTSVLFFNSFIREKTG